jgi:hypothetical protein
MVLADAFRDAQVDVAGVFEEFCEFERDLVVGVEEKLLEHRRVQGDDLLKMGSEIVHDRLCVGAGKRGELVRVFRFHISPASNSERASQ